MPYLTQITFKDFNFFNAYYPYNFFFDVNTLFKKEMSNM